MNQKILWLTMINLTLSIILSLADMVVKIYMGIGELHIK